MITRVLSWAALIIALALVANQGVAQSVYTPYAFMTVSGDGYTGSNDGPAPAAHYYGPASLALDNAGNVYVADSQNGTIRKMSRAGMVTTLAGTAGTKGSADGTRGAAQFNFPSGLTVDEAGNVYVADSLNHTIRKVTPGGVVTTLAGLAGETGSADGIGAAARFNLPVGLAVDPTGNIYLADFDNHTIRKVTAAGNVTTLAGLAGNSGDTDGIGNDARFNYPRDIVVNAAGNLYVADHGNRTIRKVTPNGIVTTVAGRAGSVGQHADGTGEAARFQVAYGLGMDAAGNVYVADGDTVRKMTPAGVVTTLAGVAASGDAGPSQIFSAREGAGSGARFRDAEDVAVDRQGDLYVVDRIDNTIRKGRPVAYTPYTFTTLAGSANYGSADGTGSLARFNGPYGVAVDAAGNLYVSDENNYTIRKISPTGLVTTLAGMAGIYGNRDGTANNARFGGCGESFFGPPLCHGPQGVAADSAGNLYVADPWNSTIRKVTPEGVVTTLAGSAGRWGALDGTGADARFRSPSAIAVDSAGNVYVADYGNSNIRKVTPAGVVTTVAGLAGSFGSADGTGSAARFNGPDGVAVDTFGNIYVADSGNNTIRKVTPAGEVITFAGSAGQWGAADGTRSAARFSQPTGVAVDAAGNVYVADRGNSTIRKVTPAGAVTTLAGLAGSYGAVDGTATAARFNTPQNLVLDNSGNLYVTDYYNNTVRKVTPKGVVTTLAGFASDGWGNRDGTGPAALFANPSGVAVDSQGNTYVADTDNNTIRRITSAGEVTTLAGATDGSSGSDDGTGSAARFWSPTSVAVDGNGNVYVADNDNSTIRKITPAGEVTTLAGTAGNSGSADGMGTAAQFYYPYGVAVDDGGNVYVADTYNNMIRKVTPAGMVTTLAGSADFSGSEDGTGSAARFSSPTGVAVDGAGNVYVADIDYAIIRKVTPEGVVTTLAGCATCPYGCIDGKGTNALFAAPWGIAADSEGNVYVSDYRNFTIRRITPDGVVTTLAGLAGSIGPDDGTGPAARFGGLFYDGFFGGTQRLGPRGVAVDSAGNVYVADYLNNTIRKGYAQRQPPVIAVSGPGFGANGGSFGFTLSGPTQQVVIIEASTDLANWVPIWTNIVTADLRFTDPQSEIVAARFYRVRTP